MIFRAELARKIKAGDKTMTRRPVKPGEYVCRYQVGRTYAVQPGRGKRSMCRIDIIDVTRQALGAINDDDAQREGFDNFGEFLDYWGMLYGLDQDEIDLDQQVWVIAFELHTSASVRREAPLFLHSGVIGGVGDDEASTDESDLLEHGYTRNPARALMDAGAVLGDASNTLHAIEARRRHELLQEERLLALASMSLPERVERAISSAKAAGVDTKRYEAAITARLRALEQRTNKAA